MKRGVLFLLVVIFSFGAVSAFEFNGTVYDIDGNALNNSVINVTVRSSATFNIVGYNFTTSNASGWFNLTVEEDATWLYEPKITHANGSFIDYVGQNLPAFPASIFNELSGTSFYLRNAGTINITAINASGGRTMFNYQIKDVVLGYPIAENFDPGNTLDEVNVVVPRNRNYSIMIFPNESLPVSFDWNNFSSSKYYTIDTNVGDNLSNYNFTTKTLHKMFNTSLSFPTVTGRVNATTVSDVEIWNDFGVIPYIFEPGNNVHVSQGTIPYNLSTFLGTSDVFNLTNGEFNLTLPASAEGSSYLLFASGRNGTRYYGGVTNFTLSYGTGNTNLNITMYGLLGTADNISMTNAANFAAKVNITIARQFFRLINTTNKSLSSISAHIETTVDYTSYGATEFTWMEDIPQSGAALFGIPLLNITGVKEMNIFAGGGDYAPKRISPSVGDLIAANTAENSSNITIASFSPQAIDSILAASSITMALYISNASCDIPIPSTGCTIGSSSSMSDFNPMSAIIGGGKLSFRMGTGNIAVHYVNVDMIASGPPDALFDNSNTDNGGSSSFDQAVRFGSGGPTIYDYVLVSIPYTETAGSGLNDSAQVNMTIPLLYDDNWNVIWNASANGTKPDDLAGNYSHYSARAGDWSQLMNQTVCTTGSITDASQINASNPCYIDTTNNKVWIRLPHFSGTGPSITGSVVASSSSSTSSSSSSGSGGGTATIGFWKSTFAYDSKEFSERDPLTRTYLAGHRVRIKVDSTTHHFGVVSFTDNEVVVNVSSTPKQATILLGEFAKFDVSEDGFYDIKATFNGKVGNKVNITIEPINEEVPEEVVAQENDGSEVGEEDSAEEVVKEENLEEESRRSLGKTAWIAAVIIFIIGGIVYYIIAKKRENS